MFSQYQCCIGCCVFHESQVDLIKTTPLSKIKYLSPDNLVIDFKRTVFAVKSGGTAELYLRPFLYRIRYEIGTKIFICRKEVLGFDLLRRLFLSRLFVLTAQKLK